MWYIIIGVFLVIGAIWGSKLISLQNNENSHKQIISNSILIENDTIKAMFSRKQIDEKLKRLAETPAPAKLAYGAECYEIAYHEYAVYEYLCPVCSEKTIYKKGSDLESNLNKCRYELEKIKGINIKLDEKELCAHCSPNNRDPRLYLLVNIDGQTDTTKIAGFTYMDIRLIHEFLDDKLVHLGDQDDETPLKNDIGRIKELLGI